MQVDQATVRRIARLARIRVSDAEAEGLQSELARILDWAAMLQDVDTEGVVPMTCAVPSELTQRDDVVTEGDQAEVIVANAPQRQDHFFVVPKVVE